MNQYKHLIICRGKSGAGKDTFSNFIKNISPGVVEICSADDFFIDSSGNYTFDPALLHRAHKSCQDKFDKAVINCVPTIVINNVNAEPKHFKHYEDLGRECGYTIFHIVLENRHGGIDCHKVPLETLKRQEDNIRNSLKL